MVEARIVIYGAQLSGCRELADIKDYISYLGELHRQLEGLEAEGWQVRMEGEDDHEALITARYQFPEANDAYESAVRNGFAIGEVDIKDDYDADEEAEPAPDLIAAAVAAAAASRPHDHPFN